MRYPGSISCIPAFWLILAMSSCITASAGQATKKTLTVTVLATGRQCLPAPESWTATWISSPEQLRQVISRCHANRIGSVPKEVPSMDFERFRVLAVEMGRQSSTGYGFDAEKVTAYMEGRTAIVRLGYHRPSQGAINAQMVTGPWVLIRLPAGPYHKIQVLDQNGLILTQVDI